MNYFFYIVLLHGLLGVLLTLFGIGSAQAEEIEWSPKCTRESCLFSSGQEIGFYSFEAAPDEVLLRLNSEVSLVDISERNTCFRGDVNEVVQIIQALSDNTNFYFWQGGHHYIHHLEVDKSNAALLMVNYDYELYSEKIPEQLKIKRCE